MATKVQLLTIDGKKAERVKRGRADNLVRRLLAVKLAEYVYQLVAIHSHPSSNRVTPIKQATYQHHIEPKIYRVNRREMEELERFADFHLSRIQANGL